MSQSKVLSQIMIAFIIAGFLVMKIHTSKHSESSATPIERCARNVIFRLNCASGCLCSYSLAISPPQSMELRISTSKGFYPRSDPRSCEGVMNSLSILAFFFAQALCCFYSHSAIQRRATGSTDLSSRPRHDYALPATKGTPR